MTGNIPKISVRGIRAALPSGTVLGRLSSGTGATEVIPVSTLASSLQVTSPPPPSTLTGLDANKPTSPGSASLYFATDTGKLYGWAGTAWELITGASSGGSNITGQLPPGAPASRPPLSSMAWLNQGTATVTDSLNGPLVAQTDVGTSLTAPKGLMLTTSLVGTVSLTAKIGIAGTSASSAFGLAIGDGTKGVLSWFYENSSLYNYIWNQSTNSLTSVNTTSNTFSPRFTFLRLTWSTSGTAVFTSADGSAWINFYTFSSANNCAQPTTYGFVFGGPSLGATSESLFYLWGLAMETGTGTNTTY